MTDLLVQDRDRVAWPAEAERRRSGRIENASPDLIALMRNPASASGRMRVAMYDAPGFLLDQRSVRRPKRRNWAAGSAALLASGVLWAAMFRAMIWAWG